jgi:hypothetical protein
LHHTNERFVFRRALPGNAIQIERFKSHVQQGTWDLCRVSHLPKRRDNAEPDLALAMARRNNFEHRFSDQVSRLGVGRGKIVVDSRRHLLFTDGPLDQSLDPVFRRRFASLILPKCRIFYVGKYSRPVLFGIVPNDQPPRFDG